MHVAKVHFKLLLVSNEDRKTNILLIQKDILSVESKQSVKKILEWENRHGLTPLHFACSTGSFKIANLLLIHGASPTPKTKRYEYVKKVAGY